MFVYMVFMFGLAVPLLLGITLDLYLLLPMKFFNKEEYVIELYLIVVSHFSFEFLYGFSIFFLSDDTYCVFEKKDWA